MSEVKSFTLQQLDCVACMMRQCAVVLKNKTVIFPCSTKRTPIIDTAYYTTADMANADCAHKRWLDALCPISVLFDVYSRSFYK